MKVSLFVWIALVSALGSCSSPVSNPTASNSILPLTNGNTWTYERTRYYRGLPVSMDTVFCSVKRLAAGNIVIERTNTTLDTFRISATSDTRVDSASSGHPLLSIDKSVPTQLLLVSILRTDAYRRYFVRLSDSTINHNGSSVTVSRLHEHVDYLASDGAVQLAVNFSHSIATGIGIVETRFVDDPKQCQQCSFVSEFYTYSLIGSHIE